MTSVHPSKQIGAAVARSGGAHRWRAFSLLALAYFMTAVDMLIVNVALPTDRKSTRLNSSHHTTSRMPSSA